jgi:hypothetical protein
MNVIRVRENMRDGRAKAETDHVAIGAPILDEERDLPAALEIEDAPQQWNPRRTWRASVSRWRTTHALVV